MTETRRVIVHIAFHRQEVYAKGRDQMANPDWWIRRAQIFKDWTLASLQNQTCQEFDTVVTMRSVDATPNNPVVKVCEDADVALLVRRYEQWNYPLAPNHHGWFCARYRDCDWLIILSMDSDDCYAANVVDNVYQQPMSEGLILHFDYGYEYGVFDGRMCWFGQETGPPPFFAKCYNHDALQSAVRFAEYRKQWGMECYHADTVKAANHRAMPNGLILQTFHDQNASSHWNNKFVKRRIKRWIEDDAEKAAILKQFGVIIPEQL